MANPKVNEDQFPLEHRYPWGLAKFASGDRLGIPAEVAEAVGWTGKARPNRLIADLTVPGCISLYREEDLGPQLKERWSSAPMGELSAEGIEARQVVDDAYRLVTFLDPQGLRFRVSWSMRLHLDVLEPEQSIYFVQAAEGCVQVMSLRYRNERLERFRKRHGN